MKHLILANIKECPMNDRLELTAHDIFKTLSRNIEYVIKGQSATIRLVLAGLASEGHVLLEDNPGTGPPLPKPWHFPLTPGLNGSSSHRIFCLRTSSASLFLTRPRKYSYCIKDRSLPISCWRTRSTGHRQGPSRPCWKPWQKDRSALTGNC